MSIAGFLAKFGFARPKLETTKARTYWYMMKRINWVYWRGGIGVQEGLGLNLCMRMAVMVLL